LPNPAPYLPYGERRRSLRHQLHTPVYASFNTLRPAAVVDLSELLDVHEHGFSVQTALPIPPQTGELEVGRAVTLCLDLPETGKFVHGSGQVVWIDHTGRAGIRFSFLPDGSRQILKEWLFSNLLVACSNYATRGRQLDARREDSELIEPEPELSPVAPSGFAAAELPLPALVPPPEPASIPASSTDFELTDLLPIDWQADLQIEAHAALLSALDDVRREIKELQVRDHDPDQVVSALKQPESELPDMRETVLRLLVERAAALTGASGAALALLSEPLHPGAPHPEVLNDVLKEALNHKDRFLCRARAGQLAPPLGYEVDPHAGLSGECIRGGTLVSCEDTANDPRVDPEVCRALGIGSFMAAPIFGDFRVVGLLEIFSPAPYRFTALHQMVLERLVELVPASQGKKPDRNRPTSIQTVEPAPAHQVLADSSPDGEPAPEEQPGPSAARSPVQRRNYAALAAALRRVPTSHLILLILTVAALALVFGYLLAPSIQEHWLRSPQSAQASAENPQLSSPSASAASTPGVSPQPTRPLTPAELRQLAESGDPDAQWQLGVLYHDGDLVPKDDQLAVEWFQRAADQGYVRAQSTLGAYYWAGRGVPQDFIKAYFWSQLALAQGDENSKSRLEGLAAQMTQSQVSAARQQAEAWLHAHNQPAKSRSN